MDRVLLHGADMKSPVLTVVEMPLICGQFLVELPNWPTLPSPVLFVIKYTNGWKC